MPCHNHKTSKQALEANKKLDKKLTVSDMKKDIASDKKQLQEKMRAKVMKGK